ncbi:MAG: hypothetical protein V4773_22695 [Verrucomicrobiota bacterium]
MASPENIRIERDIEFGPLYIKEVGNQSREDRIEVSSVQRCRLCYGPLVAYPRFQLVVGLALASCLIVAVSLLLPALSSPSKIGFRLEATLFCLAGLGLWLVRDALQRHHHLELVTGSGVMRLRLAGKIDDRAVGALKDAAAAGSKLVL